MAASRTLLLNWIYYYPVGHAVEAFAAAAEYGAADPDLHIHVLLNSQTAVELAEYCPWVKAVHAIDVDEVAKSGSEASCLAHLPREWDCIVSSERLVQNRPSYSDALIRCHEVIDGMIKARIWRGIRGETGNGDGPAPMYIPNAEFRMKPPPSARAWVRQHDHDGILCSVLLGGSSTEPIYPRIRWWIRLLHELHQAFPDMHFLITGSTDSSTRRSTTQGYSDDEVKKLFDATPNSSNCYDVGIGNQLALLELSDLFISPHTGFAFLAPCVGTPWLAISGARWPDPTYARTPFYAVLPTCPERMEKSIPVLCMDSDLDRHIPEVVEGARLLLDPGFDLAAAARMYETQARQKGICLDRLYTLGMLKSYTVKD
jgi:ADP-heptose:LPS heptosyltransferase